MNWIKMDNIVGSAYTTQELALQQNMMFACSQNWTLHLPGLFFCFITSLRILTLTRCLEFKWETEKHCSCVFLVLQHWYNISGYVFNKIWPAVLQYMSVLLSRTLRHHFTVWTVYSETLHFPPSILSLPLWARLLPVAQFCFHVVLSEAKRRAVCLSDSN